MTETTKPKRVRRSPEERAAHAQLEADRLRMEAESATLKRVEIFAVQAQNMDEATRPHPGARDRLRAVASDLLDGLTKSEARDAD